MRQDRLALLALLMSGLAAIITAVGAVTAAYIQKPVAAGEPSAKQEDIRADIKSIQARLADLLTLLNQERESSEPPPNETGADERPESGKEPDEPLLAAQVAELKILVDQKLSEYGQRLAALEENLSRSRNQYVWWLAGLAVAALALLSLAAQNYRTKRQGAAEALRFIERWNGPDLKEAKQAMTALPKEGTLSGEVGRQIIPLMNFYEELGLAVRVGMADETILRSFFQSILLESWERSRAWIHDRRKKVGSPGVLVEYERVVSRWAR